MNVEILYGINEVLLEIGFFALLVAATEAGFRLGRRARAISPDEKKAQISIVQSAILGILGLLLGFTVSMALTRFEVRKQLVLDEANAIETSWLRCKLLPAPEGSEIANLLQDYVDSRIQYAESRDHPERIQAATDRCARLQNEFWARAVAYAQKDPNPVKSGLLLQSLNQTIDLEAARRMAFLNHVPETVIYVNAIVALLAATLVGYGFGDEGRRNIFSMWLLAIAITVVLGVIIDLDRSYQGLINVSQQPMVDLQKQLRAERR